MKKRQLYLFLTGLTVLALAGCVVRERGAVYVQPPPVAVTVAAPGPQVAPLPPGAMEPTPGVVVDASVPPPVPQAEVIVAGPGPNYAWVGGYWNWGGAGWVWVPGRYAVRPWRGAVWVGGHWGRRYGRPVWFGGRWR